MKRPTQRADRLRVVDDAATAPIADDETAKAELDALWKDARQAYADLFAKVGSNGMAGNLRWLISGPPHELRRANFAGMAKSAREIAAQATALADHLERAAGVYDRRGAAQ